MYTVDASVYVSALNPREPAARHSHAFLEKLHSGRHAVYAPTLLLVELAAALARVLGDPLYAVNAAHSVRNLPGRRYGSISTRPSRMRVCVSQRIPDFVDPTRSMGASPSAITPRSLHATDSSGNGWARYSVCWNPKRPSSTWIDSDIRRKLRRAALLQTQLPADTACRVPTKSAPERHRAYLRVRLQTRPNSPGAVNGYAPSDDR